MSHTKSLIIIVFYLAIIMAMLLIGVYLVTSTGTFKKEYNLLVTCIILGGIGGLLYLLRAVYLNYCVYKRWGNDWIVWYVLRPFASSICGGVSYLFLKAGLLVLEAQKESNATNLGFYALAFIAGMNVDKFIAKIEDLAQATWGIEKSRSGKGTENPRDQNQNPNVPQPL